MMEHSAAIRSNRPEVHRPTGRYKHIAAFKKKEGNNTILFINIKILAHSMYIICYNTNQNERICNKYIRKIS